MHSFFENAREDDEKNAGRENGGKDIGGGFCVKDGLDAVKHR